MISKGTMVHVKTTNGGDVTARLVENHRKTYDAVIESGNSYAVIPAWRIASVEAEFARDYANAFAIAKPSASWTAYDYNSSR